MDWETGDVIESVGGFEEFERLVERGRQLHNQAVYELFDRLVSNAMLSLKKSPKVGTLFKHVENL